MHSKLHILYESGDKARIIAIVDYWTQDIMTPLHDTINHFLKGLSQDCTFDQDKGVEVIKTWTALGFKGLSSLDLKSATDRLPAVLQAQIIGYLLGSTHMGDLWLKIITDRSFHTESGVAVKYAVGQPMGIRSSFPMLALLHHCIVQQAAKQCTKLPFDTYKVLGDDIVIGDPGVAACYISLIESLGVEISAEKSLYGTGLAGTSKQGAEFARRLLIEGMDYSPLPVKLMVECFSNNILGPDLQNELEKRELITDTESFWLFIAGFMNKSDFVQLMKLNSLPSEVSGLRKPRPYSSMPRQNISIMASNVGISEQDIVDLYTYVMLCEELSRLDSILRATSGITETLLTAAGLEGAKGVRFSGGQVFTSEELRAGVTALLEGGEAHPIIDAVRSEVERISAVLAQFSSKDADVRRLLRSGLVESLRTSILDQVVDKRLSGAKVTRTLVNRMLLLLVKLVKADSKALMNFTIKLATIERLWAVTFGVGRGVIVSSVRGKITSFQSAAKERLSKFLADSNFDS
jgi:hypothetical protein